MENDLLKDGVARVKGVGYKENEECTTECKSQRRLDEKAPWALNYRSGETGDDEERRREETRESETNFTSLRIKLILRVRFFECQPNRSLQ